jgi:ribosome maturation factor RimP
VKVALRSPFQGQAQYVGRVVAVTEDHLVLHVSPDTPLTIPLLQIDHGVIELEFR